MKKILFLILLLSVIYSCTQMDTSETITLKRNDNFKLPKQAEPIKSDDFICYFKLGSRYYCQTLSRTYAEYYVASTFEVDSSVCK